MQAAADAGIPLVSWHAGSAIGPMDDVGIFANVTTDPMLVSEAAAKWAFVNASGEPGVVIFTDSTYQIAIDKADRMKEVIEELGGTILEYVDTPIAETSQRMPQLTTSLLQRHGAKWTHSLAINDLYFDFMGPSLLPHWQLYSRVLHRLENQGVSNQSFRMLFQLASRSEDPFVRMLLIK